MKDYLLTISWESGSRSGITTQKVRFPSDNSLLAYIDKLFREGLIIEFRERSDDDILREGRMHVPPLSVMFVESEIVEPAP